MKDQNGTVHTYVSGDTGRLDHDKITTPGSGVDATVLRQTTIYDSLGRPAAVTQFNTTTVSDPDTTGVLDEVAYTYEDCSQNHTPDEEKVPDTFSPSKPNS